MLPATLEDGGAGAQEKTSSCSSQSSSMSLEEQVMQTLEMLKSGCVAPPPAASAPGQSARKKRKRRPQVVLEASGGEDADEANATSLVFTRRRAGQPARLSSDPVALTKSRLEALFNLPIRDAADILGISITALKKACRRIGVERWPYKKTTKGVASRPARSKSPSQESCSSGDDAISEASTTRNGPPTLLSSSFSFDGKTSFDQSADDASETKTSFDQSADDASETNIVDGDFSMYVEESSSSTPCASASCFAGSSDRISISNLLC